MSAAPAKFAIFFGGAGLILSLLFSLFSGNSWLRIVIGVIVCTAVSAGIGFGVYSVLRARVPELFETFSGLGSISSSRPARQYSEEDAPVSSSPPSSDEEIPMDQETVAAAISTLGQTPERAAPAKHFGDHIIVDKVKIKNEPRLMAQAIRTMLTKDD